MNPFSPPTTRIIVTGLPLSLTYRDDYFASGVPLFEVPHSLSSLPQRVASIDDGNDFSALQKLLQNNQVLLVQVRNEEPELLGSSSSQTSHHQEVEQTPD